MTEFALHDRALVSAKIFRPLGRGAGSKAESKERTEDFVEIKDPYLGDVKVTVVATYPVGTKEEDLLLVLLSLAGLTKEASNRRTRALSHGDKDYGAIVEEIEAKGDCLRSVKFQLRVSPYLILRELSGPDWIPNGSAYNELEPRLKRLSWIAYSAEGIKGNRRWSRGASRLLSYHYVEDDEKERSIVITFNERLAHIMLGYVDGDDSEPKPKRWFTKIDLGERFALKSDVARMAHRLFSVWINEPKPGRNRPIRGRAGGRVAVALPVRIDTIIGHVYGLDEVPEGTLRRRRADVRKALAEIAKLDAWSIDMNSEKTMAYIRRLPQPDASVQGLIAL